MTSAGRHVEPRGGGSPAARPLVLFDVDLTLIASGGVGSAAIHAAFRELAGIDLDRTGFDFQGRTDYSIHRQLVRVAGVVEAFEAFHPRLVETYLVHLATEVDRRPPPLLPGARAALDRLFASGCALGLVTGNIERGARIKLGPSGVNPLLPAGGFGDRHEDRAEVVRDAIRAAGHHYGRDWDPRDVVVVGDTERDIAAGRAIGTRTVGVATGSRSAEELAGCGADLALGNLTEIERLLAFLGA